MQATLEDWVRTKRDRYAGLGDDALALVDAAAEALRGGKRLRAAFCVWGHLAIGEPQLPGDLDALVRAASSLEVLQASALVHDDVMDGSDTRRGRPSAHRAFEARHLSSGWPSSAARYGEAAAILLGDLLLSWADEMLRTSGMSDAEGQLADALAQLDDTRNEVALGQFLDVSVQARGRATQEEAMRVVRWKSAQYSVVRPLRIGAALAGASPEVHEALSRYGVPLGEAFQLRDDLLGVYGDPSVTGKPAGDDLVEGKRTLLVALALESAPALEATRLDQALGMPLSPADVDELRGIVDRSGAREEVERRIATLAAQAADALDSAPITASARIALGALLVDATQRSA